MVGRAGNGLELYLVTINKRENDLYKVQYIQKRSVKQA